LKAGDTVRLADSFSRDKGEPGRVYRYRGFEADYSSQNGRGDPDATTDDKETTVERWEKGDDTPYGTTVRVARGHTAGGIAGAIYEWIGDKPGDSSDVELWAANYSDTLRWKQISPDERNLA
ncbi:MAG: hypothetical protein ACK53L_27060, partial [Pirellulaceae bacterium]